MKYRILACFVLLLLTSCASQLDYDKNQITKEEVAKEFRITKD
jgi:hypothetical protein